MKLPLDAMCATDDDSYARLLAGSLAPRQYRERDDEPTGRCLTVAEWRAREVTP